MKLHLEIITKLNILTTILLNVDSQASSTPVKYLPTVLWHGLGDSCCGVRMLRFQKLIEDRLPGIYVYSIMIGSNKFDDYLHSYFGNLNDEVAEACIEISNNPHLQGGFNAFGLSQGAQLIRALVQRCPAAKVHNLISLGGQHQGVFGFTECAAYNSIVLCECAGTLIKSGAYRRFVQNNVIQAQLWHDPFNEEIYRRESIFLADINNENSINENYKRKMLNLSNLVLVKFLQDEMILPIETEWFGFYAPGQNIEVLTLQETPLYKEDRLGLKALDQAGKLHFLSIDGKHMAVTDEWILQEIVDPYLSTEV